MRRDSLAARLAKNWVSRSSRRFAASESVLQAANEVVEPCAYDGPGASARQLTALVAGSAAVYRYRLPKPFSTRTVWRIAGALLQEFSSSTQANLTKRT